MQSITQKGQMCYNCFQERSSAEGPCPHCGFDLAENEKKYPVALRAGTVLNGRYIVGRVLGQGGFGITYLALDTQLNAKVAIKEFLPTVRSGSRRRPGPWRSSSATRILPL